MQDNDEPARSGFALADGVLTVRDLTARPADHWDLAYLSACQTATGSLRHPDEAIHLAAAMQFLGYRHVIATMRAIDDPSGSRVADTVYDRLTDDGVPKAGRAADALHEAVQALRRDNPLNPVLWVPYLHYGP